jgi:dolichol kinase
MKPSLRNKKIKVRLIKNEIYRKTLHITLGTFLILFYINFGKFASLILFSSLLFLAIISDVIRIRLYFINPVKRINEVLARSYETTSIGAHTYFFAGVLVAILLFDSRSPVVSPVVFAMLIAAYVDPLITITGIFFNKIRHPYNQSKSVIGTSIGGLVTLVIALSLFNNIPFAVLASLLLYLLDSIPISLNDNFIYPIIFSLFGSLML